MQIVETSVSETSVRVRFSDQADAAKATKWIDLLILLADLRSPYNPKEAIGDLETLTVAEVRLAALLYARDVIGAETRRLSEFANQMR